MRGPAALGRVRERATAVIVALTAGALGGFAWGIADDPVWRAEAELVVAETPRSLLEPDRLAALVVSEQVAVDAAGRLGDDVPGADLLSEVEAVPLERGVAVRASSEIAAYATAAANAFAESAADLAARRERRRLRRVRDGLREDLAELDPASVEAAELAERLGRLDELLAQPAAVEVARQASLPTEPFSNRSAPLWTIGGALAGLLAAAGWAVGRPRRQQAISTAADAASCGLPVVRAPRSSSLPMGLEASELLSRLSLGHGGSGPEVVGVVGAGGGERPPELAAAIAMTAAARGAKTLLVDCDIGGPTQAGLHGVSPAPGLADYLRGRAGPQEVLRPLRGASPGGDGIVVVLPAGDADGVDPLELMRSEPFAALFARTAQVYDLVVLDAPAFVGSTEGARLCIDQVEAVVVVAEGGVTDAGELERAVAGAGRAALAICAFVDPDARPGVDFSDSGISRR